MTAFTRYNMDLTRLGLRRFVAIALAIIGAGSFAWTWTIQPEDIAPETENEAGVPHAAPPTWREHYLRIDDNGALQPVLASAISDPANDPTLVGRSIYADGERQWTLIKYRAPLGTDSSGRDILNCVGVSYRHYAFGALIAAAIAVCGGIALGFPASNLWGRNSRAQRLRSVTESVLDVLESMPKFAVLFLLTLILGAFPKGSETIDIREFAVGHIRWFLFEWFAVALGFLSVPRVAKLIVERVNALEQNEFIDAARALGLRSPTILFKHILWHNARFLFATSIAAMAAEVVIAEVAVSILSSNTQRLNIDTFGSDVWSIGKIIAVERSGFLPPHIDIAYYWRWLFPLAAFMAWVLGCYGLSGYWKRYHYARIEGGGST